MISKEQYTAIRQLKAEGFTGTVIAQKLNLSAVSVRKWWNTDEKTFDQLIRGNTPYMDQYREFILSILRVCPQIRETNLLYRLKEEFPEFHCNKRTFYRYMKQLREQTGFLQFSGRVTSPREESPPGYEAQVDFGQYRMKDLYGQPVRVYFFCMVLAYSRMHFLYFSREPFTTKTAIQAHEYAFQYFGGRPRLIMYDQDRVFVVSENFGNILLVPKFENFVRSTGFSVHLCRPHDPQSKGKVETFVRYVKESFLQGRIFAGIDSLNSAALRWLDTEANGTTNLRTRKPPRELFREEIRHLEPVNAPHADGTLIRSVSDKYTVIVDWSVYELPRSKVKQYDQIRVEEENGVLLFYMAATGTLLHKCPKKEDGGVTAYHGNETKQDFVKSNEIRYIFEAFDVLEPFLEKLTELEPRYKNIQCGRIIAFPICTRSSRWRKPWNIASRLAFAVLRRLPPSSSSDMGTNLLRSTYRKTHTTATGVGPMRFGGSKMASITELQELARKLSLANIAGGVVNLQNESLSNLDYLKMVFEAELAEREKSAIAKRRKESRLPRKAFSIETLNKGVAWHIQQLENLSWIEKAEDLILLGRCDTGKTSLVVHLGELALETGHRVYYCSSDEFLDIVRNKDHIERCSRKFKYMLSADLIILDEVMYVALSDQDLPLFYRAVNFLKEERSMIYITNRELSDWSLTATDRHLMQTLTEKLTNNSQLVRLT